jgi:hypothetical protein
VRRRFGLAWTCYGLSAVTFALGFALAARHYPNGFDWTQKVMSSLASVKHNPEGGRWFAGAIVLSFACLWPVVSAIATDGFAVRVLRAALLVGILVGVDQLLFFRLSDVVHKGHEALAVVAFVGTYIGVVGLQLSRLRKSPGSKWSVALVLAPLVAVGVSQLVLYLAQRSTGWVDHDWHQRPFWGRFAFWQWLAGVGLWLAIGQLLVAAGRRERGQVSGT